jgi:hypothetical protein
MVEAAATIETTHEGSMLNRKNHPPITRIFLIATAVLLVVGFAMNASAGPRLYSGSIIIKGFSNDTTDGTTAPFTMNTPFPMPFGKNCRIGAFVPAQTSNGTWGSWSIPAYGGQAATLHTSASKSVIASCEGTGYSDGEPLIAGGSFWIGATLSTTGTFYTPRTPASPKGFAINEGDFFQTTSGGSQPGDSPYLFAKNYAQLWNGLGNFGASQGPGRLGGGVLFSGPRTPPLDGARGSITVTPGPNKFGGTMRLLGTAYSFEGFYSTWLVDTNIAKYTWLLDYHGATGSVSGSNIVPKFGSSTAAYIGRNKHLTNVTTVHATAMSWTTGTVTVTATGGPFHTVIARRGYDIRNSIGAGGIQMVSPMLTRWVFDSATKGYYTGSVATLHLCIHLSHSEYQCVPEPEGWMLLSGGLSLLGLLYRANRR